MPRSLKPPGTSEWRGILLLLQNLTQDKERFFIVTEGNTYLFV